MLRLFWSEVVWVLFLLLWSCKFVDNIHIDGSNIEDSTKIVTKLLVAPLIYAPTENKFEVNAVVADGDPKTLKLFVKRSANEGWSEVKDVRYPADDIAEWSVTGLLAGRVYPYAIVNKEDALKVLEETSTGVRDLEVLDSIRKSIKHPDLLFWGNVVTQRAPEDSFSFAIIADTHLRPHEVTPGLDMLYGDEESTLFSIVQDIKKSIPDFIVHLGDVLDFHDYGFNDPPPNGEITRWGYLNYRRLVGDLIGNAAHFMVIGNWDGENGEYTQEEIDRSRTQRLLYLPGPKPDTYPQGGSKYEDYYAFTWGDALFIVLNVMSYTSTPHLLSSYPGLVDDWTLGEEQIAWFENTLSKATSKWRFVFIHHTVGGAAGDLANSAYGRGGGQAAYVGEQAKVHNLMLKYGVQIFFYAHDHVFTDMIVDGIHYTLPGSAGAIWKFVTAETGYTEYFPDSGHGIVTVTPQKVLVKFVAMGGEIIKSYTIE